MQLPTIDEGLQDVLLHIEIAVDKGIEFLSQPREVLHGLANAVIGDIVGGRLGAQQAAIPDVLFQEAMLVVAADDRVGQIEIFDDSLQLAVMIAGDPAAKDEGQFVRLTNSAIGIEEPLFEGIDRGAATENKVVTILSL